MRFKYEGDEHAPRSIVVFGKYAGMETKLNDEKLLVMKEDDIIAIAVKKPPEKAGVNPYDDQNVEMY